MPDPQFVGTTELDRQPETYNEQADERAYLRYLDHLFRNCCFRYPRGDAQLKVLGDQVLDLRQHGGGRS
jgi:hypothetical protein